MKLDQLVEESKKTKNKGQQKSKACEN